MIKAIIFDLDGTLLDSTEDIKNGINKVLIDNKFAPINNQDLEGLLGYGSFNLVKDILGNQANEDVINKVFDEYMEYYPKNSNIHTKPYEDIMTLVKLLKANGFLLAIASNKMQSAVSKLNDEIFGNLFDMVIGDREGVPVKPDPTMLNIVAEELELNKDEILFIGDTEVDLKTARDANIKSVAVTWGFRTKAQVLEHNPTYLIESPLELLDLVEELNKK